MENNAGIDYGRGLTNIDTETGIRYGVISQNEVLQAWADSSEPDYGCDECEEWEKDEDCNLECSPLSFDYVADGYIATCGDDGDIFVIKSPYFTLCRFCSPCAPGAGYLMNPDDNGIKSYCFGHDWFDNEQAPYRVFDVKTGMEVKANG